MSGKNSTPVKTYSKDVSISNKKASFDYSFEYTIEAGIVLLGTEVKALRAFEASFTDAYCRFIEGELYLVEMHMNVEVPKRARKLLLHKSELRKLYKAAREKGFTIVPTRIYTSSRGIFKIEIALAKGKKTYDKKESIKAKDLERDSKRID